jgi:hypothetical protein
MVVFFREKHQGLLLNLRSFSRSLCVFYVVKIFVYTPTVYFYPGVPDDRRGGWAQEALRSKHAADVLLQDVGLRGLREPGGEGHGDAGRGRHHGHEAAEAHGSRGGAAVHRQGFSGNYRHRSAISTCTVLVYCSTVQVGQCSGFNPLGSNSFLSGADPDKRL